ncbi:unnamed protein product, partial [marine sediment metagenome]
MEKPPHMIYVTLSLREGDSKLKKITEPDSDDLDCPVNDRSILASGAPKISISIGDYHKCNDYARECDGQPERVS